jgi:antitoxin CptB
LLNNRDIYLKQLIYRSWHRGCKETDILLGDFAKAQLAGLSDRDLQDYEKILEASDNDVYEWIAAKSPVPSYVNAGLIKKIQTFHAGKSAYANS